MSGDKKMKQVISSDEKIIILAFRIVLNTIGIIWGVNRNNASIDKWEDYPLTVWGAFSHNGLCDLIRIMERMNSA